MSRQEARRPLLSDSGRTGPVGYFEANPGVRAKIWRNNQLFQYDIADAVEARGQHVHEKAADELVGGERHHLVALGTFEPVVLPLEGDAFLVACDQAAI